MFEFLAKRITGYVKESLRHGLLEACRRAYRELLRREPAGMFNIMLSNGHLSFAFVHRRPFYLLHRPKNTGDVALLSTLKLGEDDDWIKIEAAPGKAAKMLVFSGPSLTWNADVR